MKLLAMLALACGTTAVLTSSQAPAQTDLAPNSVGIYFDEGALGNSVTTASPGTATAYLIATRYDGLTGVDAWRGGVSCEVPVTATMRGEGLNGFSNGPDFFLHFEVTLATPLPLSTSIVLAELAVDVPNETPIRLFLESSVGGDGLFCSAGGAETSLQPSVPCHDLPCFPAHVASINQAGPVRSDPVAWGGIKSLYR
jgi:hypothetical protein